jgi:hypothetical protein
MQLSLFFTYEEFRSEAARIVDEEFGASLERILDEQSIRAAYEEFNSPDEFADWFCHTIYMPSVVGWRAW